MSAIEDRTALSQPYTVEGAVNSRLRWARAQEGLSQEDWRRQLTRDGFSVSKASVSEYEQSMKRRSRGVKMPPFDYMAQVSRVFGYRLEWLADGRGEARDPDRESASTPDHDPLWEGQLFGTLPDHLQEIHWAVGSMRPSLLRLFSEAERADRSDTGEDDLRSLAKYLNAIVPKEEPAFVPLLQLTPRQREHVMLHVRGLSYLLFLAFQEADRSYIWSRVVAPPPQRPPGGGESSTGGNEE